MSTQPLYQQVQAGFQAGTKLARPLSACTITFPPVPQGLVWSGSIALSVPSTQDLAGVQWTMLRNGQPLLTWTDFGTPTDIQAVGQEVISIVGNYMGDDPANIDQFTVTATWTGQSDDAGTAPILFPHAEGVSRGLIQVTTPSGGPFTVQGAFNGSPLPVTSVAWPDPSTVQTARLFVSTAGTTTTVLPALTDVTYQLWALQLQVSVANSGTTAGTFGTIATYQLTDGVTNLWAMEPICVQASALADSGTVPMFGYQLPTGVGLNLLQSTFSGSSFRTNGLVVYTTV